MLACSLTLFDTIFWHLVASARGVHKTCQNASKTMFLTLFVDTCALLQEVCKFVSKSVKKTRVNNCFKLCQKLQTPFWTHFNKLPIGRNRADSVKQKFVANPSEKHVDHLPPVNKTYLWLKGGGTWSRDLSLRFIAVFFSRNLPGCFPVARKAFRGFLVLSFLGRFRVKGFPLLKAFYRKWTAFWKPAKGWNTRK